MVLARYNLVGRIAVFAVVGGCVGAAAAIALLAMFGGRDAHPQILMLALVLAVLLFVLPSGIRALASILAHGGRAVFVQDGVLVYLPPAMPGGLRLRPADIKGAWASLYRRERPNRPADSLKGQPLEVVEVALASGRNRQIAAYALDVTPGALAAQIDAFGAGKVKDEARAIVS